MATYDDYAGSGGGLANPVLYQGLMEGNRSLDSPFSPRSALRLLVWGPPFVPEREEAFLDAMFQVQLGDKGIPGDKISSPNWPFVAPGKWGHLNAMSPRYIGNLIERILDAEPKVKVLWIGLLATSGVCLDDTSSSDDEAGESLSEQEASFGFADDDSEPTRRRPCMSVSS